MNPNYIEPNNFNQEYVSENYIMYSVSKDNNNQADNDNLQVNAQPPANTNNLISDLGAIPMHTVITGDYVSKKKGCFVHKDNIKDFLKPNFEKNKYIDKQDELYEQNKPINDRYIFDIS